MPFQFEKREFGARKEKIPRITDAWPPGIPQEAPELWEGKRKSSEELSEFFRRVWSPYLRFGLRMSHIKILDKKLYMSIRGHIEVQRLPWPADLLMPTQRSQVRDAVRAFNNGQRLTQRQLISVASYLKRQKLSRLDR